MNARQYQVIVIGAGGAQAQAMVAAAARGTDVSTWLAVDRRWRPATEAATQALGITTREVDPLQDPETLKALLLEGDIVANLAGPYYRTGTQVLDAAIETRTTYMDICDDADVTLPMLERAEAAQAAGVTAVIGMGSSPGTTNILIRAAVDYLGPVQDVEIAWTCRHRRHHRRCHPPLLALLQPRRRRTGPPTPSRLGTTSPPRPSTSREPSEPRRSHSWPTPNP